MFAQEALAQICEYSEAGITVRGTFFPPGKEPKGEDERKLYLAIEATSELAIGKAKKEITRLIKEELCRLVSRETGDAFRSFGVKSIKHHVQISIILCACSKTPTNQSTKADTRSCDACTQSRHSWIPVLCLWGFCVQYSCAVTAKFCMGLMWTAKSAPLLCIFMISSLQLQSLLSNLKGKFSIGPLSLCCSHCTIPGYIIFHRGAQNRSKGNLAPNS